MASMPRTVRAPVPQMPDNQQQANESVTPEEAYALHVRCCVMRLRVAPMSRKVFTNLRKERDRMVSRADDDIYIDTNLITGETWIAPRPHRL